MTAPVLSAVVCTRNRAGFLGKCLASLLKQAASKEYFEILVVDNGSEDETAAVVEKYNQRSEVRYVFEPVVGLSRARNTGWRKAQGSYVGYIDDDAVTADTWVASALWVIEHVNPRPKWFGGPIELDWEVPNPGWIDEELMVPLGYINLGSGHRNLDGSERLGGGNSIYERAFLEQINGFDERLGRRGNNLLSGEETQLQRKIERLGENLYYHPGITIYHWVGRERVQPRWFYRRFYWGGITDYFMGRSLGPTEEAGKLSIHPDQDSRHTRFLRMLGNFRSATGIFVEKSKMIQARIYLAYVMGYCVGSFKWRFLASSGE